MLMVDFWDQTWEASLSDAEAVISFASWHSRDFTTVVLSIYIQTYLPTYIHTYIHTLVHI